MQSIPAPLKGKVAVVTGGSRGLGACIAETFARNGCTHIAITYNSNDAMAKEVEKKIHAISDNIKTYSFKADISDPKCGEYVVQHSMTGLVVDHIDIMVSCAAKADAASLMPAESLTKEFWDEMMTADAWTPFVLAREASKHMRSGGRIILLSSGASKGAAGDPLLAYSAAKAAMDSVTRNLAAIYGLENKDITVNSISIGPTETDTLKANFEAMGPAFKKSMEDFSPLKRVAQPQEIADIVAFVASPGSSWMVGNAIPANGGALNVLQG